MNVNASDRAWAEAVAGKICKKELEIAKRSRGKIPYSTQDGRFDDYTDRITWWTNGFYGGLLWQLYHAFGIPLFREMAEQIEEKLDKNLTDYAGLDHDNGFKWLLTAAANYQVTGNEKSKNRTLLAAANLTGRFNLAGRFLRAWNDEDPGQRAGWAIIDCMMNLPLLHWAADQEKDPRFSQIACAHADTVMKYFVRENGSVHHIVCFDAETGEMTEALAGQGYAVGSSWTRGQAWAIYGFALSFRHTGRPEYLETAKKVARYFLKSLPESGFVPVDFDQPVECEWEDSTAAAIVACGLLELEAQTEDEERKVFHDGAMRLLITLGQRRCCWDENVDFLLEKCSAAYHDDRHHFSIIYGDYFFTEAVLKLCGKDLFLW